MLPPQSHFGSAESAPRSLNVGRPLRESRADAFSSQRSSTPTDGQTACTRARSLPGHLTNQASAVLRSPQPRCSPHTPQQRNKAKTTHIILRKSKSDGADRESHTPSPARSLKVPPLRNNKRQTHTHKKNTDALMFTAETRQLNFNRAEFQSGVAVSR